jgi:hypothetical protein
MSGEKALVGAAVKAGVGAVAGIATGLSKTMPAPHAAHAAISNFSASFFNSATKALRSHKGLSGALAAGTTAAITSPTIAAAVIVAAPYVAVTATLGGAAFGAYKLVEFIRGK